MLNSNIYKKMNKTSKLEKGIVIALVLNYLGVVAKSMTMYDLYHGLSVTVKVGKKNYTVDSEKIAFLRSIGINVDVEIVDVAARDDVDFLVPFRVNRAHQFQLVLLVGSEFGEVFANDVLCSHK